MVRSVTVTDQDAFILNAYGEGLAINSAYREYHRSPFHKGWTWQTKSKNDLLIGGFGPAAQDKMPRARSPLRNRPSLVWTTGDATVASQIHAARRPGATPTRRRGLVDQRYFILRDRVTLNAPERFPGCCTRKKISRG